MKLTAYTNRVLPPMIGEYEASVNQYPGMFRWWNGKFWSQAYRAEDTEDEKRRLRRIVATANTYQIYWRGLAEEPANFMPPKPLKPINARADIRRNDNASHPCK